MISPPPDSSSTDRVRSAPDPPDPPTRTHSAARNGVPHAQRVLPAPLRARRAPPLRASPPFPSPSPPPALISGARAQLYLDERHLEWMSDRVLQYVLLDLRPLIAEKLIAEAADGGAGAKKGGVDVKRGDTYQFAYFLRKAEPHSVLIKTRTFTAAPPAPPVPPAKKAPPRPKPKPTGKRKPQDRPPTPATGRKKRRTARADSDSDEEEDAVSTGEDSDEFVQRAPAGGGARRSTRARGAATVVEDDDGDIEMDAAPEAADDAQMIVMSAPPSREPSTAVKQEPHEPPLAPSPPEPEVELDIEEEEPKPKPLLRLAYQGFNILGSCLCVVVEPWPPVFAGAASRASSSVPASRASSSAPASRAPSVAPPEFVRARTPLFLPDDMDRGETPGPFAGDAPRALPKPPVPLFDAPPEEAEDALMSFSQSLNYAGARGAEDDDEFEGAVFFGDADEARGF
ncbi:hypothetical protein HWV62_42625 [Athelia sp. TMB]|nr:hypothetical protein HWV62_42625 [Athelia sp. TMB]